MTAVASGASIQSLIKYLSLLPKIAEKGKRKNVSTYAKVLTPTPEKNDMELQAQSRVKVRITQKTKSKSVKRVKINGKLKKSVDETCVICGEPYSNSRAGEIWLTCAVKTERINSAHQGTHFLLANFVTWSRFVWSPFSFRIFTERKVMNIYICMCDYNTIYCLQFQMEVYFNAF